MANSMAWHFRRQYLPVSRLNCTDVSNANYFIENFSSLQQDEYQIEGEMGMPLPPFVARFSPDLLNGHMLGIADEDGHVTLIDTSKTKSHSIVKEWAAHSNAVFDLAWVNKEAKIVTASGDQTARLWDVEKTETLAIFKGHTCSLKSVAVQPRCSCIFLTGARDGKIMLWDTRCSTRNGYSSPVNTIRNAHVLPQNESLTTPGKKRRIKRVISSADSKHSVTAVVFQDNYTIISSGACDGVLKYWDTRKTYTHCKSDPVAFHIIPFPGKGPRKCGYSSISLNSSSSRLYAVCTNDVIYEYATTNLSKSPIATYQGHLTSSFYVKAVLSPDDRFLLCGSGDNNAYIWKIGQPNSSPWILKGHFGEVTSVAWSPGAGEKIVTCSDDNTFKIWRLFQEINIESHLSSTGKCERKDKSIRTDTVSTDSDVSAKMPRAFYCKPIDLISDHWTANVYSKNNCQSPATQATDEVPTTCQDSPFINTTPTGTIRQKLPTTTSSMITMTDTTPLSTSNRRRPSTPKSSRLFMESWLKSPTSPNISTLLRDKNEDKPESGYHHTTRDFFHFDSKVTPTFLDEKTESKIEINSLPVKGATKDAVENIMNIQTTPKLNKRKPISRRKKDAPSNHNIRTLILSVKRKRESEDNELQVKQTKAENENQSDDQGVTHGNEKEQINVKRIYERKSATPKVKDLLDHAEESTLSI